VKTVGIIGGIGPESTLDYYRRLIDLYRERRPDGSYPRILINSVNLTEMVELITASRWDRLTDRLSEELRKLVSAGADFGVLAANTPHVVFDGLRERCPIPLLSIVEATCDAARARVFTQVGLFGTRFTMQGRFYPDVFARAGIRLVSPDPEDQAYIHEKYMGELVAGVFLPATRDRLIAIARKMKDASGIQGLILGGTELPLILRDEAEVGLPLLDTTAIHVERIVGELLS
jgi:aspartate racemase